MEEPPVFENEFVFFVQPEIGASLQKTYQFSEGKHRFQKLRMFLHTRKLEGEASGSGFIEWQGLFYRRFLGVYRRFIMIYRRFFVVYRQFFMVYRRFR